MCEVCIERESTERADLLSAAIRQLEDEGNEYVAITCCWYVVEC